MIDATQCLSKMDRFGNKMKLSCLVFTLAHLFPAACFAEMLYGSFLYDDRLQGVLFLTGEIRQGDSFELRKALRDRDIQMVETFVEIATS